MTDRDVVERFAAICGTRARPDYSSVRKDNRKLCWRTQLYGPRAQALMKRVLPLMGTRRSERIQSVLDYVRERDNRSPVERGRKRTMAHKCTKLNEEKVRQIVRLRSEGWSCNQLAERFGVSTGPIGSILRGRTWKWVEHAATIVGAAGAIAAVRH